MADYSNPYGSAYSRAQANKQVLERLEKSEKKKQEEELKNQKEREEIARNIKRREERMRNQEFGIVENPWTATVVPKVETPSPTIKKKERRRTGDFSDLQHINKSEKKNNKKSTSTGDGVSEEVVNLLRANQEAQRKEILNLTEQLDAKTREVIALRLTLNEVKEERKKINAEARAAASRSPSTNKAFQSAGAVPVASPPAPSSPSSPSPERHAKEIEALKEKHEKEQQNLNWQLQMRDLAIEKLKENLTESKGIAQQAQALAEKREEQCKMLAVKTRELIENAKLKEADYFLLQEELKKTKALLVSMLREKNG